MLLILNDTVTAIIRAPLDVPVFGVGIEKVNHAFADLSAIGHRHRNHVALFVKQRVQLIALHGRVVCASQFDIAFHVTILRGLLHGIPQRHHLAPCKKHIIALDVHAIDAVALKDAFKSSRNDFLPFVFRCVDAFDRNAVAQLGHALHRKPLQVVGDAGNIIRRAVTVHEVGITASIHDGVHGGVVFRFQPSFPAPLRHIDALLLERSNNFFG